MFRNKTNEDQKTLRPSQRKSITKFSTHYGVGLAFEEKQKIRKIFSITIGVVCFILIMYFSFYITDTLIKITELPITK